MIKEIAGFPGYYASDDGEIIGKRGKPMGGHVDKCGYREVNLSYHPKCYQALVHRLILMTYNPIENMELYDVNHIDGNKLNNSLDNLEWCTRSENIIHSYKNGLQRNVANQHGNFKVLTAEENAKIIELHKVGLIDREIAKKIGCSRELVGRKIRKAGLR